MTLGKSPTSEDAFRSGTEFCRDRVSASSIYGLLYRESHRLFPDEAFADLFAEIGRWSVPPRIVAVVMVLQRLEGLSDREAVDRITFDLRWKYAAGGLDFDYAGFVHTVLVDMRARLRRSERPNRIFEMGLEVAREAGLIGRKRVLDSTALYDAVATQDTVTLIRSAIRALLRIVDERLNAELSSCCKRDDDYLAPGKPSCDWDDVQAREALVDTLARDAYAILAALDGRTLTSEVTQAAKLVATVVGQDLEQRDDGMFRIARRVATNRVISTVDPEARHGHKTAARGFDGYKGHLAIDPDSEIITATTVTAGNVADGSVGGELVADVLDESSATEEQTIGEIKIAGSYLRIKHPKPGRSTGRVRSSTAESPRQSRPSRSTAESPSQSHPRRPPAASPNRYRSSRSTATLRTERRSSSRRSRVPALKRTSRCSLLRRPRASSPRTPSTSI